MGRVGILYPGELGASLGSILVSSGQEVVTTVAGRSTRTERRAKAAGLTILPSMQDVVAAADIIVSTVPPMSAFDTARNVASALPNDHRGRIFVDLNSISPMTMAALAASFDGASVGIVDGAIHGRADALAENATVYLSGREAGHVAAIFGGIARTVMLGGEIGQASQFKMLLAGINKGVVALMLELSWLAMREGVLDAFWVAGRTAYPGVMDVFDRLLPSYATHVGRRMDEMAELAATVRASGGDPYMADAIRRTFEMVTSSPEVLHALIDAEQAHGEAVEASSVHVR